jgi:hypothetical protein
MWWLELAEMGVFALSVERDARDITKRNPLAGTPNQN